MSQILMPDIFLLVLTAIAKGSIAKVKSRGDKGQPYLVERWRLKGLEIVLLVNISTVGFVYNDLTHLINVSPRPYLGSRSKKYFHSILSNAWLASTDNIAVSPALLFSNSTFKTLLMLWKPCRCNAKPF